jgi:hypothetical protein
MDLDDKPDWRTPRRGRHLNNQEYSDPMGAGEFLQSVKRPENRPDCPPPPTIGQQLTDVQAAQAQLAAIKAELAALRAETDNTGRKQVDIKPPPRLSPRKQAKWLRTRCGAWARSSGKPCIAKALKNGRCRFHGGLSTGPKTPEGKARCTANLPQYGRSTHGRGMGSGGGMP